VFLLRLLVYIFLFSLFIPIFLLLGVENFQNT
jgi:hypothetical protein